jgi:hypothetical protein
MAAFTVVVFGDVRDGESEDEQREISAFGVRSVRLFAADS